MLAALKLTPTSVRDFQLCPRRFEQRYLHPTPREDRRGAEGHGAGGSNPSSRLPESAAIALGVSIHSALEALHSPKPGPTVAALLATASAQIAASTPDHDDVSEVAKVPNPVAALSDEAIERLLSEHWKSSAAYADQEAEERAFLEACKALKYYTRSSAVPQGEVIATEAYLSCLTNISGYRVEITCRADRLELRESTLYVVDYKVGTHELPPGHLVAEDLGSYLAFLLVWRQYRGDARVRSVAVEQTNILTLKSVQAHYDQRQILRNRERLAELVRHAMRGPFEPRPGPACPWCPYQEDCPARASLDLRDLDHYEEWQGRAG